MLNPLDPTSSCPYQNYNVSQSKDVIYDLYKTAEVEVGKLDDSDSKQKELSDWFSKFLKPSVLQAHDLESNSNLRENLEEFIDRLHQVRQKK